MVRTSRRGRDNPGSTPGVVIQQQSRHLALKSHSSFTARWRLRQTAALLRRYAKTQGDGVKSASGPLAGRLLPRLVIMHSSAETEPRPPEDTYVQAYRMTQFIGAWGRSPKTSPFQNPPTCTSSRTYLLDIAWSPPVNMSQ